MASGDQHVQMLSKDLQNILKNYPSFTHLSERHKIRCDLSGHEMPCHLDVINSYINGKKFQKLLAKKEYDYDKYKQHIIPSVKKGREHQLFCLLTLRHISNAPVHIERHVKGRRFLKAYKRWEDCQKSGETFKPLAGRRKRLESDPMLDTEDKDSDDKDSDVDSLSDLYPAADFAESNSEDESDNIENTENMDSKNRSMQGKSDSDSDFEFEDLETPDISSSSNVEPKGEVKTGKGNKRKHSKGKSLPKQIKKKKNNK